MDNPATWIWVLIPLAAIAIAPFRMWMRIKEKQIEAQTGLAAERARNMRSIWSASSSAFRSSSRL